MEEHLHIDWEADMIGRDRIVTLQNKRLKSLLDRAWKHVPFYQRIWKERGFSPDQVKGIEDVAKQMGLDPQKDFKVRVSLHTAEPLTSEMRHEIQTLWGFKAYDNYGSVETGAPHL